MEIVKKTVLISGSTDGIGLQTALELAMMGHEIILHGRKQHKGTAIRDNIRVQSKNDLIHYYNADFCDFAEINDLANQLSHDFPKLDVLINNAGVFENERVILPNGLERTFMVNHMASFSLTLQLLALLQKSPDGRIINVSSIAQAGTMDFDNLNGEKYFDAYNAYALSKLENILFTYKLHRLLKTGNLTVNCLHPGVISTKLLHAGWGKGGAPLSEGSITSVFLATSEEVKDISGQYFSKQAARKSSAISYDQTIQDRMWNISEEICGISFPH